MKYDVFGFGSPMVDFSVKVDENLLLDLGLKKGMRHLQDETKIRQILNLKKSLDMVVSSGGACANTMTWMSVLGGKTILCGAIGTDRYGQLIEAKIMERGVKSNLVRIDGKTGVVVCLITPDSERTMVTFLGVSNKISENDVSDAVNDVKNSKYLYLTGYALDDQNLRKVSLTLLDMAKKNDVKVAFDFGDCELVKRNRKIIRSVVYDYSDLVFANKQEVESFSDADVKKTLDEIGKHAIAIVKLGKNGSIIKHKDKIYSIASYKVRVIDTTGAGDAYAAGFLYGLCNNAAIEACGKLASYVASKVIGQFGATL